MLSEKVVAQITNAIANLPDFSCTQREKPLRNAAWAGTVLPAMKPATHAIECSASTSEFLNRT